MRLARFPLRQDRELEKLDTSPIRQNNNAISSGRFLAVSEKSSSDESIKFYSKKTSRTFPSKTLSAFRRRILEIFPSSVAKKSWRDHLLETNFSNWWVAGYDSRVAFLRTQSRQFQVHLRREVAILRIRLNSGRCLQGVKHFFCSDLHASCFLLRELEVCMLSLQPSKRYLLFLSRIKNHEFSFQKIPDQNNRQLFLIRQTKV